VVRAAVPSLLPRVSRWLAWVAWLARVAGWLGWLGWHLVAIREQTFPSVRPSLIEHLVQLIEIQVCRGVLPTARGPYTQI
jgi:ABC-type antimicrobial peptide transport system permease subunit